MAIKVNFSERRIPETPVRGAITEFVSGEVVFQDSDFNFGDSAIVVQLQTLDTPDGFDWTAEIYTLCQTFAVCGFVENTRDPAILPMLFPEFSWRKMSVLFENNYFDREHSGPSPVMHTIRERAEFKLKELLRFRSRNRCHL